MIELILIFSLQADNPYEWEMSCERFLEAKQRIVLDENLDPLTKNNLLGYLRTKLNEPCVTSITSVP